MMIPKRPNSCFGRWALLYEASVYFDLMILADLPSQDIIIFYKCKFQDMPFRGFDSQPSQLPLLYSIFIIFFCWIFLCINLNEAKFPSGDKKHLFGSSQEFQIPINGGILQQLKKFKQ